jgi:hypothetical protein
MSEPRLEDKLHSLVDHLDAPASTSARHAVGHRTRVLRRRRRTRYTVLGVAVVAVVAGMLSLLGTRPDVETGPSNPGHSVPAVTVDLDGWEVVSAEESLDDDPPEDSSYQVFRRRDTLAGPSAFVEHTPSSDTVVPMAGQEPVDINGAEGALSQQGRSITLSWNPDHGDSTATLYAWDLTRIEVEDLARSLATRDDDLGYPPTRDMEYGFDVADPTLPEGIEEDAIAAARARAEAEVRLTELRAGAATIRAQVDDRGELAFEETLGGFVDADDVEDVRVLDRPAVLIRRAGSDLWTVPARLDDGVSLQLDVSGVDRAAVDEILDHVEEIDEKDWRQLLADR